MHDVMMEVVAFVVALTLQRCGTGEAHTITTRQLSEQPSSRGGCTVPSVPGTTTRHAECPSVDVCADIVVAQQDGVGDFGKLFFDGSRLGACTTTLSARPGQHIELIFTPRFVPLQTHQVGDQGSLLVADPALLPLNAASLVEHAANSTYLWPRTGEVWSTWRGVSSSYQVVIQHPAEGSNEFWELAWSFINGSCTDGRQVYGFCGA